MAWTHTPTAVLLACSVLVLLLRAFRRQGRPHLPPGPRGLPLIGNALQLPTQHEWLTFTEWAREFGEVVHVSAFGQPIVILNSVEAINELLEVRSKIYSSRPTMPMVGELVGYKDSPPLCPSGDRHRELRKLMHGGLAPSKMPETFPIQEHKMKDFLHNLLQTPDQMFLHIRNVVASIVFQVSHGYTVQPESDPLVLLAEEATLEFSRASAPGAFFVDLLPALRHIPDWFPGAGFKTIAKQYKKTTLRLRDEPYQKVKNQIASGTAFPSFTSKLIETNPNATPEQEDLFKWASTGFYSGGADTTVSAISWFFLAMLLHPDVQKKAQEEIDRVVGRNRLPNYGDRSNLPYVDALIKEVLRWNPVGPLAFPHRLIQDDVYKGHFIPADSIVFGNTWAIFRDPELFPSPEEFKPERYLSGSTKINPHNFAFGYGRRICPGQHLADATLYLTVVSVLSMFAITNAIDESTGQPIVPSPNHKPGIICHPEPFKCTIKPRYSDADIYAQLGRV